MDKVRIRQRVWATIAYPESCDRRYLLDTLNDWHLDYVVSPLHYKDTYTEDAPPYKKGDYKKPHWHVMLRFGAAVGWRKASYVCDVLGATMPEPVLNWDNYVRYMLHIDGGEGKALYTREELVVSDGLDYQEICDILESGSKDKHGQVLAYLLDNRSQWASFADFVRSVLSLGREDWIADIKRSSYFYKLVFDPGYTRGMYMREKRS